MPIRTLEKGVFFVYSIPKSLTQKDIYRFVRAKSFQAFLLSGGPNGRLARGDELFEMEFTEGDREFYSSPDPKCLEAPTSL